MFENPRIDGERVIALARMVSDGADFAFWRSKRQRWTRDAIEVLERASVDEAVIRNFERVTSVPPSTGVWAEDLAFELERVQEGLELLSSLLTARDS